MNMQKMMKEMQKMQSKLVQAQSDIESKTFEAEVSGGMVKVSVNGKGLLNSIEIDPDAVDPDDVEALEDLILSAINQALEKKEAMTQEKMGGLTNGMKIPGL